MAEQAAPPLGDEDAPPNPLRSAPAPNGRHVGVNGDAETRTVVAELEAAVVGDLLLSEPAHDAAVERGLAASDFYDGTKAAVAAAVLELHSSGEEVDAALVVDHMRRTGRLEYAGGAGKVYGFMGATPGVRHAEGHIDAVRRAARDRRIAEAVTTARHQLDKGSDPVEVATRLRSDLGDVHVEDIPTSAGVLLPMSIEWSTFWAQDRTAEDWLVEPFLPAGRMTAVWASHKSGKSLLSLEVAAALATGRPILGRRRSEPVHTIYIDMEMTEDDLYERLEDMGYGAGTDLSRLHYYLLPSLPPLDTAEGGSTLEALVLRDQARVVVIDTMARVVKGEENESTTYRSFYQHTGLRLKMHGVTGLRLDHSGKDPTKGQRGSSAKGDDIDVGFELRVAEDGAVILARKLSRVSWVPERVALRRLEDPLRHVLAAGPLWPAGTRDAADDLDRLDVALDASCAAAMAVLKEHELGRRKTVVLAALKWRRERLDDAGTAPGTALSATPPEPHREPQGDQA